MSYSYTGRLPRRGGLGYLNDLLPSASNLKAQAVQTLQTQASQVTDPAKQQAIGFAQQQLQDYPQVADVMAQYNQYSSYLQGINPADMKDPAKVAKAMQKALLNYAAANGIPTNTQGLEDYALQIAQGYTDVPLPAHFPQNAADLKKACVDIAVTAVIMDTGINPELITVTVQSLLDGKLSMDDCTAIGTTAGAIAGAAIGSAVGIPAPIGAFIGGLAGGMVGGTIAEIFGLYDPQEEVRRLQAAEAAFEKSTIAQAQAICHSIRGAYWDAFDNMVIANELRWQTAEVKIGWKFGIRWYGQEREVAVSSQGQPFSHAWDPNTRRFSGPVTTANRATYLRTEKNYGMIDANGNLAETDYPVYSCALTSGCPYPVVPSLGAGAYERDAQAYLARGAYWIPPAQRSLDCPLPLPPSDAAFVEQSRIDWLNSVNKEIANEAVAINALQIISVAVTGDLTKSAATVAAEKALTDQFRLTRTEIGNANIKRVYALVAAKKAGEQLSDALNYSALFIGVGVLGVALRRRYQS